MHYGRLARLGELLVRVLLLDGWHRRGLAGLLDHGLLLLHDLLDLLCLLGCLIRPARCNHT